MAVPESLVDPGGRFDALTWQVRRFAAGTATNPAVVSLTVLLASAGYLMLVMRWPEVLSWAPVTVLAVAAGVFLPPRHLLGTYAVQLALATAVAVKVHDDRLTAPSFIITLFVLMVLLYAVARHRAQAGVVGLTSDAMVADMRDRLNRQVELPELPLGWGAEARVQATKGAPLAGDLVVSNLVEGRLQVTLLDISGKGYGAGSRALMLAGAMGGLLGAVPPGEYLGAANRHLCRTQAEDEFATAVHLSIELGTGSYEVSYAGHPPAVQYFAGAGRWRSLVGSRGPALGIVEGARYPQIAGTLRRGDAIILFSDGIVEARDRSLTQGLDAMVGKAEKSSVGGFAGLALTLCENAPCREDDDRSAFVIWRS